MTEPVIEDDGDISEVDFMRESLRVAVAMREAQRNYFQDRDSHSLRTAKQLERVFDNRVAEHERRFSGNRLF